MSLRQPVGAGHILGRYQLLVPIAAGGMAMVWAARLQGSRGFQRTVALKMMLPSLSEDGQFEEMFLNEATIASRIRHDNVVQILDLGEDAGLLYLVMEWIDGEPLSVLINLATKQKIPIPMAVAVRLAMQTCAGLHAAHELRDDSGELYGVVHRDVSPQNVLVSYDGTAKILDFGIARITREAGRTQSGTMKGKAAYMAPEQVNLEPVDRRTDVFAAGILLYRMTTGRHPFRGESAAETLTRLRSNVPFTAPRDLVSGYPRALEAAVMRALARDPKERFATAKEMLEALEQALPPSMRATTGEAVAGFMGSMLGGTRQNRQQELTKAIRAVDEAGPRTVRIEEAGGPPTFTSSELLTEFQRFRNERDEVSGSSQISSRVQPPSGAGAGESGRCRCSNCSGDGARSPGSARSSDSGSWEGSPSPSFSRSSERHPGSQRRLRRPRKYKCRSCAHNPRPSPRRRARRRILVPSGTAVAPVESPSSSAVPAPSTAARAQGHGKGQPGHPPMPDSAPTAKSTPGMASPIQNPGF